MKKGIIILLAICFSFTSCKKILDSASSLGKEDLKKKDLKIINVNDIYSMAVPEYMSEMKSLNEEASFEYANIFKETYVIVIDENKQDFINTFKELEIYKDSLSPLDNYSEYQMDSFKENMEEVEIKKLNKKIRNYTSNQYEFSGKTEGIHIKYLIGFVEGKENMYMMMSWTLKDRFKKYKNTFQLTQNSFKIK